MTVTDEVNKLIRKMLEPAVEMLHQNELDSYDETKNPAIRPIKTQYSAGSSLRDPRKESTFKVRKPFKVSGKGKALRRAESPKPEEEK